MKKLLKLVVIFLIAFVIYISFPWLILIFYSLNQSYKYSHSFYITENVKDYNDSRIKFYNYELEKAYEKFTNAKTPVEIFKSEVMSDLADGCIEYYLQDVGETEWISVSSKMRHNARNKDEKGNEKLIEKKKKNINFMGKNFYLFDLNQVDSIEESIKNMWRNPSLKSRCDDNLTAEEMYDVFLPRYVKWYTEDLTISRTTNHSINEIEDEEWLEEITKSCKKCPKYKTFHERVKAKKQRYESLLFDMAKGKIKMKNYAYMVMRYGVNLNIVDEKGRTPLFYLAKSKNGFFYIKGFIKYGADIYHKDKYGKTVFDYFDKNTNHNTREILQQAKDGVLFE